MREIGKETGIEKEIETEIVIGVKEKEMTEREGLKKNAIEMTKIGNEIEIEGETETIVGEEAEITGISKIIYHNSKNMQKYMLLTFLPFLEV